MRKCPTCGSENTEKYLNLSEGGEVDPWKCKNCGSIFEGFRPDERSEREFNDR